MFGDERLISFLSAPIPSAAPAFKAELNFQKETPIEPAGVSLAIIYARRIQQPWSAEVDLGNLAVIETPGNCVALSTFGDSPELQPSRIIFAL